MTPGGRTGSRGHAEERVHSSFFDSERVARRDGPTGAGTKSCARGGSEAEYRRAQITDRAQGMEVLRRPTEGGPWPRRRLVDGPSAAPVDHPLGAGSENELPRMRDGTGNGPS
jgi:hypothetical protein